MNKEYKIKLDLNKKLYNKKMAFNQFDENVNDFYIEVTKNNKVVKDLGKSIITLVAIKPNGEVDAQFIEVKEGQIYANLKPSMCDLVGNYQAKAMITLEGEIVITDTINYSVNEDKIISKLNEDVISDERFTLFTDALARLSTIEINETNRENNFNDIKEQFEIIKNNHNELVTIQTSKRVDEITQPIVEENVKKHTEKVINELSDKVVIVDSKIEEVEEFIKDKNNAITNTIDNANIKINEAINKIPPKSELVGEKGDKGDTPSIAHLETTVLNKVNEIETRFNTLTSKQQQDAEVIDARDGEASLKARLDRDIEKAKQIYVDVEGSNIHTDSSDGYAKDVEILGNTIQSASNLADIRSVGDKLEGQELYEIPVLSTNGLDSSDSNYQEHKLTILSPKTLKSYNGTKDRIVCKNNVWVHEENVTYDTEGNGTVLSTPIDTPLPYDQQVKLRTFANKTNIHFLTEIEPTLKASVPKSIGATVNSHTEQIDNLGKELDRVKKLEESVASTVTTESGFTTVEQTSNGYFEDVKIEGKTLVNVAYKPHLLPNITHVDNEYVCNNVGTQDNSGIQWREPGMFKIGQIYTIIFTVRNTSSTDIEFISGYDMSGTGWRVIATIPTNTSKRVIYTKQYTNTTINYYLINLACKTAGASFAISDDILILEGDHTQNPPEFFEGIKSVGDGVDEISVLSANKEETKQDKKRILYYNDETQTWEKPILREWDSIEKHSDGKYYYHKRSGEVTLNGSEIWNTGSTSGNIVDGVSTYISLEGIKPLSKCFADKLKAISYDEHNGMLDFVCITGRPYLVLNVSKSKLSSNDIAGVKTWLASNNVTVVYQLAEEKVYECTNLDLITYNEETNLLVKSGVLSPKTTLKLKSGVGNVVSMLQRKVTMLEDLVNKLIQSK